MEITDEEVDHIFEEIVARFRKAKEKGAGGTATSPHGSANGGAGAKTEVPHDG
jgi:hypothetical protein